jgi:hypothetical protein
MKSAEVTSADFTQDGQSAQGPPAEGGARIADALIFTG